MQNLKTVTEEIEVVGSLKLLAFAFEEISVIRIQRVRGTVLQTREYLQQLSEVFSDVKASYKKEIDALIKQQQQSLFGKGNKHVLQFATRKKNGKSVEVLLSANTKFYGTIIQRVYDLFIEGTKTVAHDIVIVGKLGKDTYEQEPTKRPYAFFEIPDIGFTADDLKSLIAYIMQYEYVNVYYGKFANVVNQIPTVSNVTGEQPAETVNKEQQKISFHFEPTLENILFVFESQVFTALFKQTVHESELSKLASRVNAMEQALSNITVKEKQLGSTVLRVKRSIQNHKQIEALSGISLWKKR